MVAPYKRSPLASAECLWRSTRPGLTAGSSLASPSERYAVAASQFLETQILCGSHILLCVCVYVCVCVCVCVCGYVTIHVYVCVFLNSTALLSCTTCTVQFPDMLVWLWVSYRLFRSSLRTRSALLLVDYEFVTSCPSQHHYPHTVPSDMLCTTYTPAQQSKELNCVNALHHPSYLAR